MSIARGFFRQPQKYSDIAFSVFYWEFWAFLHGHLYA